MHVHILKRVYSKNEMTVRNALFMHAEGTVCVHILKRVYSKNEMTVRNALFMHAEGVYSYL